MVEIVALLTLVRAAGWMALVGALMMVMMVVARSAMIVMHAHFP